MRGIHSSQSSTIVLSPSAPLTEGGSLDIANGNIALLVKGKQTKDGLKIVDNLTDYKNAKYYLEVGTGLMGDEGALSTKGMRTVPFAPKDVLGISYSEALAPTQAVTFIGYNGINDDSLDLSKGEASQIHLTVDGDVLAYHGYTKGRYTTSFALTEDYGDASCEEDCTDVPCAERTIAMVEKMKAHKLMDGLTLGQIMKITPVISDFTDSESTATAVFYTLNVIDSGDSVALGLVQAQYAGYNIARIEREGQTSTYQVVDASGLGMPSTYVEWAANIKTECGDECPTGYTSQEGGFMYSVSVEDNGTDIASSFNVADGIINTITDGDADATRTAGTYSGVTGTFSGAGSGASFNVVVDGTGAATSTIVSGGVDFIVGETITISDDDLGAGGAADLVITAASLETTITAVKTGEEYGISKYSVLANNELTSDEVDVILTLGSGTAKISMDFIEVSDVCIKDDYASTDWAENGSCEVSEVAYSIELADTKCGNSRLAELQANYPNLVITEGEDAEDVANCRRRYFTNVITNMVCDECYKDVFTSEAPTPFETSEWSKVEVADRGTEDSKCGIRFEGKEFANCPDKKLADRIGTVLGQTEIHVSAGELTQHLIGYKVSDTPNEQTRDSRAFRGTGWGVDYMAAELESYDYHVSVVTGDDSVKRSFQGSDTKLDPCGQYDTITLKVRRTVPSQSFTGRLNEYFKYIFVIPQGSAELFKPFFNKIAAGNPEIGNI